MATYVRWGSYAEREAPQYRHATVPARHQAYLEKPGLTFEQFGHIGLFTVEGETNHAELGAAKATLMREMDNIRHLVLNVVNEEALTAAFREFLNSAWRFARHSGKIVTIVGLNTWHPEVLDL